jgi:hypothetical protein
MSSSFSDALSSQDDSKINFIPGYIMEVEDGAVKSRDEDLLNENEFQPYSDEPIADQEWIDNYYQQRCAKEEKLEELHSLLSSQVTLESW